MSIALGILLLLSTILSLITLIVSGKLLHSYNHQLLGPLTARIVVFCSNTIFLCSFGSTAALFSMEKSVLYIVPIFVFLSAIPLSIPPQIRLIPPSPMQLILLSMLTTVIGVPIMAIYILIKFLQMKPELI
jgi:hypothetical protein